MIIDFLNISHFYGSIQALDDVTLSVSTGEIVGLVGDNGAGKSTLMKILAGALIPTKGTIKIDNDEVHFNNPLQAREKGIEMLYQDLSLFDHLDVTMNMFAGREITSYFGILDYSTMAQKAKEIIDSFSIKEFSPMTIVSNLSGGQRQVAALARTIGFGSKIVILDEPTAALSPTAVDEVLEVVLSLKEKGLGVIMIAHNIDHIIKACDRIAVLRLGKLVGIMNKDEVSKRDIIGKIIGE